MSEPQVNVQWQAARWEDGYGALPPTALELLEHQRQTIATAYIATNDDERQSRILLTAANGCLDRLNGCLLYVSRMAKHASALRDPVGAGMIPADVVERLPTARPEDWQGQALAAHEICTDFESLVFHARAALDRATRFVAPQFGSRTNLFSKLRKTLGNAPKGSRPKAQTLLKILDETTSVDGVLLDLERDTDGSQPSGGNNSLRSKLAHSYSVSEGATALFTWNKFPTGDVVIFDCESLGYPVMRTSWCLAQDVPFLVLNLVAHSLDPVTTIARHECAPAWQNPTLVFCECEDPSGLGPVAAVVRSFPGKAQFTFRHIRSSILQE